jgi:hypothetical protein
MKSLFICCQFLLPLFFPAISLATLQSSSVHLESDLFDGYATGDEAEEFNWRDLSKRTEKNTSLHS